MTKREPWQDPPVHPATDKLPMMSDAELAELAADIKANGLQEAIILWEDNREAVNGSEGPFPLWLLDGRNRLAALKLLGITDPHDAPGGAIRETRVQTLSAMKRTGGFSRATLKTAWVTHVDPATFVVSLNVHRRHLTTEQKRQAIADHIKADPTASDREIGRKVGVDNKTAAKVRADLEAREEIPHVPTRTDSAGRKQPAAKPKPIPKPTATARPEPIDEDTVAEQPITTPPPGGLTENSPGQTDRVKEALDNAQAATVAIGPAPDDSDTGPDFGIVFSRIAIDLDKLAVYVTSLDTDARLKVVKEHIDAIDDVTNKLQRMLQALKAAQKTRAQERSGGSTR